MTAMSANRRSTHPALQPGRLGPLALRNRLIRTGAFEGMCPNGVPSDALVEHHVSMAAGGVAMTTVAYCSVSRDGRHYDHQMWIRPEIVPALRRLTDAVHREGAAASVQLGHCGYFAGTRAGGGRPLGPSVLFNLYGLSLCRAMDDEDVVRVTEDFGRAARLAVEAGFDAIEVHAGHGYLLSQFLSPFTNRRRDRFGGSLSNRLRFPLDAIGEVRRAVGPDKAVLVKMNLEDGFEGGLGTDEAVEAARAFVGAGADALVPSGGFVSRTPFYMMRGGVPVLEMVAGQDRWFRKVGLLLFGRFFVQTYEFDELFFLAGARRIRAAVDVPVVLVGGVCSGEGMSRALREGFPFLALGRALIRDPDLPRRLADHPGLVSDCDHCNRCVAEMDRGGVRCVCPTRRTRPASRPPTTGCPA
jgi:2,4-dienoyl-CoA reductase-like NADH-dependent reductase (Old Yellow Enzyme family)